MNAQRKRVMIILFIAFLGSLGIFRMLVTLLSQQARNVPTEASIAAMRPLCYGMAGMALLLCIGFTLLRLGSASNWQRFQTNFILSLALSQSCTIFGLLLFILGGSAGEFNGFLIASAVVDLVVILPFLLRV